MAAFSNYQNNKKDIIIQNQGSTYKSINKLINNIKYNYYNKRY